MNVRDYLQNESVIKINHLIKMYDFVLEQYVPPMTISNHSNQDEINLKSEKIENDIVISELYTDNLHLELVERTEKLDHWINYDVLEKYNEINYYIAKLTEINEIAQKTKYSTLEEFSLLLSTQLGYILDNLVNIKLEQIEQLKTYLKNALVIFWNLRENIEFKDVPDKMEKVIEEYLFFVQNFSSFCDEIKRN